MTSYLHVHCGRYQFLIASDQVLAIEDRPARDDADASRRLWRGRLLPLLDLCAKLDIVGGSRRQQVVVGAHVDDPDACILEVDSVQQLTALEDDAFVPLAPISDAMRELVDAAHLPRAGEDRPGALRLRLPLASPHTRTEDTV